jgi:hypothetical protein
MSIHELLAGLGITGEAAVDARKVLEAEGVTNPRKQRIATSKVERARDAIDRHWRRLCHNCRQRAMGDGRLVVAVPPAACSACAGSNNTRAVREMVAACISAGVNRLVVVGGSPNTRLELSELIDSDLELRQVDGTRSVSRRAAHCDIAWADLVVVLGATQLAHKVSTLYTRDSEARRKLVSTSRRGIEAIADEIMRSDVVCGRRP